MAFVTSSDGTKIAYEVSGKGPALILVDGAMCYRDSGPMRPLAQKLSDQFTVIAYDRRGRGESGNTLPWSAEREVEDLGALVEGPGQGSVFLYGASSGGALALAAAEKIAGVKKVIVYEIPVIVDATRDPMTEQKLRELDRFVAAGKRSQAVSLFMRFVGVPAFGVWMMRLMMGKVWSKLTGIAHTLPYDLAMVSPFETGKPLPRGLWHDVRAPVLVGVGGKSPAWMKNGQAAIAKVLGAEARTLPDQTHMVAPDAQAPMIREFFR